MKKLETNNDTLLAEALAKGNRFYARGNFPLAKREFETAARIQASQDLLEKIQHCTAQMAIAAGKEAIKRGRRLEKKGRYREALEHFEKAAAGEPQEWLTKKIAELRARVARRSTAELVERIGEHSDPRARITVLDQALAVEWKADLVEKKADCLVELEEFQDALDLYGQHPPTNDPARLRCGIAWASTGRYAQAVAQWLAIEEKESGLLRRVDALLPFAAREAETNEGGYATVYNVLHALPDVHKDTRLKDYERYFKFKTIEELWRAGAYEEILALLSPLPQALSPCLLALYAKLYFKLADQDSRHLETAISFWLTAVYNEPLLRSLAVYTLAPEDLNPAAIRERLIDELDQLINRHARQGDLPAKVEALWKTESRMMQRMSGLALEGRAPEIFPCSPLLAARIGLAEEISAFLAEQVPRGEDEQDAYLEIQACFSPAGQALMLLELGEEEQAMSALPRAGGDAVALYCRRRVYLGYGIKMALRGERQLKKYFSEALPLLTREPRYVDRLIELAYTDEEEDAYTGLAEVMEFLSTRIGSERFLEATAHVMAIKAVSLLSNGVKAVVAEKLLRRALAICPDAELARNTLIEVRRDLRLDDLYKAFKRQQFDKAAGIVLDAADPKLTAEYFETLEKMVDIITEWKVQNRVHALRDMHRGLLRVDATHPLGQEIASQLKNLEQR